MTPQTPRLRPLTELHSLSIDDFALALMPLFEAAGPLVKALFAERPFASYASLIDRAEALARAMPPDQQVEVVNAHPRIGASPAELSALSYREQGLDQETGGDLAQVDLDLARLNSEYEARYGFRFVVFVNGRPRAVILEVLRQRLGNPRDVELQTAVAAIFLIARDRLAALGQ